MSEVLSPRTAKIDSLRVIQQDDVQRPWQSRTLADDADADALAVVPDAADLSVP